MSRIRAPRKYRFEQELAPHVDPVWAQELTVELRLRGASGETIGEALAEVDSYCADSGESAAEAFGSPAEYAQELELPAPQQQEGSQLMTVVPILGQILGMLPVLWALPALSQGQEVVIRTGQIALLGIVFTAIVLMTWRVLKFVQFVLRRPVVAVLSGVALVGLMVLAVWLLQAPVMELSPVPMLIFGAVMLTVATVWGVLRMRSVSLTEDMVSTPLEDEEAVIRRANSVRWTGYVPILMMPVYTALLALVLWLFA
ncbi:DUF1129 domain-containing protein [Nesterenkonia ebinurensis]|uniref:hypothetical protein n=1 Tax=Nesterenkonia ebinurensis TaxID=2608252 RepID=UPI00123CB5BF|nr:hypothetical protein [Nesterenkonia ebinurensis]